VGVARLPGEMPDGLSGPGAHAHEFLVLLYAERAHGRVVVDGRTWTVADGDLFVIAPEQVVAPGAPAHVGLVDTWAVFFPPEAVRLSAPAAFSSWRSHPLLFPFARGAAERTQRLRVPPGERSAWAERFVALDGELRGRRDGYHQAALAHLTLLLVAVSRLSADLGADLRAVDEPVLAAVFEIIEDRYRQPLSLADVAAEVGLSAGHLTTVVRHKTGRTVQQWIAERRMRAARQLLLETDLSVAALGHRVGYRDVSYFIKRFRHDHDMTPRQWRQANRARR
jgi:AraC family transcriptional regulator, transcriptional activator of pobA